MQSFDDDPESGGSQDGSSDDEQDQSERLDQVPEPEDVEVDDDGDGEGEDEDDEDGEGEGEVDGDGDGEVEGEDDANGEGEGEDEGGDGDGEGEGEGEEGEGTVSLPTAPVFEGPLTAEEAGHQGPSVTLTSPSPQPDPDPRPLASRIDVRPEALTAKSYDIVPTIAAPQSTSINVVAATPDLRWVFSGGSDGYIRKFNWVDTANNKLLLTVAQRHPFVDSVTKAGVLVSYWENEDPQPKDENASLSPVYSLAVHNQALWLLSGLESGGINLQSVRHEEGKRILCLRKHTSAVSVLNLAADERSVLSGSWDKTVLDWDLDTGQAKRSFIGGGSQISVVEMRPLSSLPVPEIAAPAPITNGTFSSNNEDKPKPNAGEANGALPNGTDTVANADAAASPVDSLFGGGGDDDDLFGESAADVAAGGGGLGDDDDDDNEFSRAIARDIREGEPAGAPEDINMMDAPANDSTSDQPNGVLPSSSSAPDASSGTAPGEATAPADSLPTTTTAAAHTSSLPNGISLPHAEDAEMPDASLAADQADPQTTQPLASDTTFMAASIDGSIRVWDKRQPGPALATMLPRNTPPWCMGACWSPDGNYIYAGRRNGTVEEFSLHKGLGMPERTFRFPNGSGPVSAVRAMPNGRHLVCASHDILRLYDLKHTPTKGNTVPFLIVPGHRTGTISQLFTDLSCRFMISTAGNRGWEGSSTQVLLGYEIGVE